MMITNRSFKSQNRMRQTVEITTTANRQTILGLVHGFLFSYLFHFILFILFFYFILFCDNIIRMFCYFLMWVWMKTTGLCVNKSRIVLVFQSISSLSHLTCVHQTQKPYSIDRPKCHTISSQNIVTGIRPWCKLMQCIDFKRWKCIMGFFFSLSLSPTKRNKLCWKSALSFNVVSKKLCRLLNDFDIAFIYGDLR